MATFWLWILKTPPRCCDLEQCARARLSGRSDSLPLLRRPTSACVRAGEPAQPPPAHCGSARGCACASARGAREIRRAGWSNAPATGSGNARRAGLVAVRLPGMRPAPGSAPCFERQPSSILRAGRCAGRDAGSEKQQEQAEVHDRRSAAEPILKTRLRPSLVNATPAAVVVVVRFEIRMDRIITPPLHTVVSELSHLYIL